MATTSGFWQDFRHWRQRRPFWGGLFLLLGGLELFFSANLTLGDMAVHIGPQGFLSYLLPLICILCALLGWFTPAQRIFYGIIGAGTAVYSLLGLNFGGFFLGMLLGMAGGALMIAWGPPRTPVAPVPASEEPDAAATADEEPDGEPHKEPAPADAQTRFMPGFDDPEGEPPSSSGGMHRKAFVIAIVPLAVTSMVLVAGSHTPASAATCPTGLPSRSAAATTAPAEKSLKKTTPPSKKTPVAKKKTTAPAPGASTSSAPAAGEDDATSDHPILDGIKDGVTGIVDGIGKVLGIGGDDPAPEPSGSAAPSPSESVPATPKPTVAPSASEPAPSGSATPSGPAAGSATPSASPSSTEIPCLGARVMDKVASPDDLPVVSLKGATLETDRLTMYNSTYDGVTKLTTTSGEIEALKFSMTKSENTPFKLTVPEAGGRTTVIDSDKLTIDGNVRFYTPHFEGKLFGVIPVTFTPESPPPLTLPVLWFTDVKINLAFVRADTLTADPLKIREIA